jgi:hypothetical protein
MLRKDAWYIGREGDNVIEILGAMNVEQLLQEESGIMLRLFGTPLWTSRLGAYRVPREDRTLTIEAAENGRAPLPFYPCNIQLYMRHRISLRSKLEDNSLLSTSTFTAADLQQSYAALTPHCGIQRSRRLVSTAPRPRLHTLVLLQPIGNLAILLIRELWSEKCEANVTQ